MAFFDTLWRKLGVDADRVHVLSFLKASAPGVTVRFTRDLRPFAQEGLTGGHLLELYAVLDERHDLTAASEVRFDVLEEDWLFSGGLDDRIASLLGTGAAAPEPGAPTRRLTTVFRDLAVGEAPATFVERFKASVVPPADYADSLLVLKEAPDPNRDLVGTRRTHVIAWHRVEHDDIGAHSELYFVLDVRDGAHAASPVLELEGAPDGVALRLRGVVTDAAPLAGPEPLEDIPVTLGGRRSVSAADGVFVVDARLAVGDHPLRIARPGIEPRELTVRVTPAAGDAMTVAVLDGAGELVSGITPQPATEASVVSLALADPLPLRVHKLRGTVHWPDTRFGHFDPDYRGTPLADRRVYVLPLPAAGELASFRPATTGQWETLKARPDVLRSARPGRPSQRERTGTDGRFEVKYVDFTAGNRFLLWVERFAPRDAADQLTEAPDHLVRTLRTELISVGGADITTTADLANLDRTMRTLVDHEFNVTRDVVPWGVDTLRITDIAGVRTLSRPNRANREAFDTAAALAAGAGEDHAVPAERIVDGLRLQVLPLVPLTERADQQGRAARIAREALAGSAAIAFPAGADVSKVRLALDVSRLAQSVDWDATTMVMGVPVAWEQAATTEARMVELLEQTLVAREELGRGKRLGVDAARWHFDALSLADTAFVLAPTGGAPLVTGRHLDADWGAGGAVPTHLPVMDAVAPVLPGLTARRVYLAPGHGLYVIHGNGAALTDWGSNRPGYTAGAGEDESGWYMAHEVKRIIECNDGGWLAPREMDDITRPGLFPAGAAVTPDFPRRWQQNPHFFLAAAYSAGGNGDGINRRTDHIRANARAIDLVIAPHTNGDHHNHRGTVVEYLNVENGGAEGNPLGLALAQKVLARTRERTRLDEYSGGTITMDRLNSIAIADLTQTFDHHVLEDAAINDVCEWRVLQAPLPPVPAPAGAHAAPVRACWRRTHPPPPNPPPAVPPPSAGARWQHMRFPAAGAPVRIPVALSELAFHDHPDDAALLSRNWFRRLAAEGTAIAIDEQLREDPAVVRVDALRAVLGRLFGETAALAGLAVPGAVTPGAVQGALQAVAHATAPLPPTAGLGAVCSAALTAAGQLRRRGLVDAMREALEAAAGWEAADATATRDRWVAGPMTGGATLERPTAIPTRAEAGTLACMAIGLDHASLDTAEKEAVGDPPATLMAPTPRGESAFFPLVEATLLTARLRALEAQHVHRVLDVWLGDARWSRLDTPRGSGNYELDPGTPVVVVLRTGGAAWKTLHQGVEDGREDIEIVVEANGMGTRRLRCERRTPLHVASETWILDLPATRDPVVVTVELRARQRSLGWRQVKPLRTFKLTVRSPGG